jgi:hypothetical protein
MRPYTNLPKIPVSMFLRPTPPTQRIPGLLMLKGGVQNW